MYRTFFFLHVWPLVRYLPCQSVCLPCPSLCSFRIVSHSCVCTIPLTTMISAGRCRQDEGACGCVHVDVLASVAPCSSEPRCRSHVQAADPSDVSRPTRDSARDSVACTGPWSVGLVRRSGKVKGFRSDRVKGFRSGRIKGLRSDRARVLCMLGIGCELSCYTKRVNRY